jgi:hypothetical protein
VAISLAGALNSGNGLKLATGGDRQVPTIPKRHIFSIYIIPLPCGFVSRSLFVIWFYALFYYGVSCLWVPFFADNGVC